MNGAEGIRGTAMEGLASTIAPGAVERARSAGRKRPIGVSVLAVFNIIGAALFGLAALGAGAEIPDPAAAGAVGAIFGSVAVFGLVVAIGLWRLRNWARITAVVLYSLSCLGGVVSLFTGAALGGFVQLLVAGGLIAYLCSEGVRDAFDPIYG